MIFRLAKEGILAGVSSGATCHAAVEVAKGMSRGNVIAICGDGIYRYLSALST